MESDGSTDGVENAGNLPILGDLHEFPDGRFVFIGTHPKHDDTWFVAFQRADGHQTKIKLSHEALDVLARMHANFPPRTRVRCPSAPARDGGTMAWRRVVTAE